MNCESRSARAKLEFELQSRAFTFFEAMIVIAVVGVLALAFLPMLAKPRHRHGPNCTNNLRQVSLAFSQWALDNNDKFPMRVAVTNGGTMEWVASGSVFQHFLVMSNEMNTPKLLFCPQETKRSNAIGFDTNFSNRNVTYFVGVDADNTQPDMLLVGDDCFAIGKAQVRSGLQLLGTNSPVAWIRSRHGKVGNVGLADGRVMACDEKGFRALLIGSGNLTNRLAIP